MSYRPKIASRPNGIKEDRQEGFPWNVWRCSVHPKHVQEANKCQCRCAGRLPAPQHVGLWGMGLLIALSKAFLRGANPAAVEINARASLYFKGTGLNSSLHALEFVLCCDHLVPSDPHNCYCCSCKCASQRRVLGFFSKVCSEGFHHFMMFLIINCQKTQQK